MGENVGEKNDTKVGLTAFNQHVSCHLSVLSQRPANILDLPMSPLDLKPCPCPTSSHSSAAGLILREEDAQQQRAQRTRLQRPTHPPPSPH
jgi:hypothetical protein